MKAAIDSQGQKSGMNPFAAGVVIGGAIGAGATVLLADEQKRKMAQKKIVEAKDYALNTFERVTGTSAGDVIEEGKSKIKKQLKNGSSLKKKVS